MRARRSLIVPVIVLLLVTLVTPMAFAARGGQGRAPSTINLVAAEDLSYWSIWNRYDNQYYLDPIEPTPYPRDGLGFTFDTATRIAGTEPVSDDPDALFQGAYLGAVTEAFGLPSGVDLTGNRLSAAVHLVLEGGAPSFLYPADEAGEAPDITPNTCGGPATVALYFESWAADDGYWYVDQSVRSAAWATLDAIVRNGSVMTLKALLKPSLWVDTSGVSAVDTPEAFAAAVTSVSWIGITLGGGCYSATGVALEDGTATGQLHLARIAIQR